MTVKNRGRPRSFIDRDVRAKMQSCFARQGYHGTTVVDLSEATGLSTPSIYNAFGDKRAIFLRALDDELKDLTARLSQLDSRGGLSMKLTDFIEAATAGYRASSDHLPGIAFGAALAEASIDPDVRSRLRRFDEELGHAARRVFIQWNYDETAPALLSTLVIGLCVRLKTSATTLEDVECVGLVSNLEMRMGQSNS